MQWHRLVLALADEQRAGRRPGTGTGHGRGGRPEILRPVRLRAGVGGPGGSESLVTVIVAFGANLLIALAKSAAAVMTGSASMLAEAAHSWADTGNEIFLLIANRRSRRPPDPRTRSATGGRPTSGRCSRRSGCSWPARRCRSPTASRSSSPRNRPATSRRYIVLAVSFVLEGFSFLQSVRQARRGGGRRCTGT